MRINRSNPDQPAMQQPQAQPQAAPAAPKPAPKREPPKQEPPKPKKEKPKKKPTHEKYDEYEDDEEEPRKRRFPFGCLIVLILLALVGSWTARARWAQPRPSPCRRDPPSPALPPS